jgi:NADPH-dependent 2,4-dienoyl-CoA reductase/sulfur reductase-like enzyme
MEMATNAGLAVADGITVDECGRTSAPEIFAARDNAWHTEPSQT